MDVKLKAATLAVVVLWLTFFGALYFSEVVRLFGGDASTPVAADSQGKYKVVHVDSIEGMGKSLLARGLKASPGGIIARQSFKGMKGIVVVNNMTGQEMVAQLVSKGFTESYAAKAAPEIIAKSKSILVKGGLIGIAAGGATWMILEATAPSWSLWKKLGLALLVGATGILFYAILRKRGVLA